MTHHLGYEKHTPTDKPRGTSRNGIDHKTLHSKAGELTLQVPRDRRGSFEPQIVRKRQRRLGEIDNVILSLYARGLTQCEIAEHLQESDGVAVSAELISAVTDAVLDEVKAWQSRPLDAVYAMVYLDAIVVKAKANGHIQNRCIYLVVGVTLHGYKEVLGFWACESEGAKFWLSLCNDLKNRGVKDILIACVDGLKGFPEAIAAAFPQTQLQLGIVHLIRSSTRQVAWKDRKEVAQDLKG